MEKNLYKLAILDYQSNNYATRHVELGRRFYRRYMR